MRLFSVALILLIVLPVIVHGHGDEVEDVGELSFADPVTSILYSIVILVVIVCVSFIFGKRLTNLHKKILFIIIVVSVLFSTAYVTASTVYINMISESGGPIHWHADIEIWACGEKVLLEEPEGFDNKVGTGTLHHHNEGKDLNGTYRIHVEGVLVKLSEGDLEHYFEAINGELTETSLSVINHHNEKKTWKNGDICKNTGKVGKLKILVNEKEIENGPTYIISPYSNVPPGDFIKVVFE